MEDRKPGDVVMALLDGNAAWVVLIQDDAKAVNSTFFAKDKHSAIEQFVTRYCESPMPYNKAWTVTRYKGSWVQFHNNRSGWTATLFEVLDAS